LPSRHGKVQERGYSGFEKLKSQFFGFGGKIFKKKVRIVTLETIPKKTKCRLVDRLSFSRWI
jgi:hypothetical protein